MPAHNGNRTGRFFRPRRHPFPGEQRRLAAQRNRRVCSGPTRERSAVPAPAADKITLLRRVTLDLTGIPPTPAEVDAFLADDSPRLTKKSSIGCWPRRGYGERMAAPWLDAARYADTNGYQTDGERDHVAMANWLINALNRNMPFDQFTIEQLAGDQLPQPTLERRIATGFQRNHRRQWRRRNHRRGICRRVRGRPGRDHRHRVARSDRRLQRAVTITNTIP